MLRSGCEIGRFVSPVGSVILVPVGCSWHEHSVVLRVRHMFKCVFFYSRWPLSTSHLLPLVFGGGGSFLFWARRKLDDDGGDRMSGSCAEPF